MILSERNFGDYLFDAHHIIEYGGLLLILFLGAITRVGTLVPLGYFIGKAYPEVIEYAFYMLLFPLLLLLFLCSRLFS
jgi:hypothetical protein